MQTFHFKSKDGSIEANIKYNGSLDEKSFDLTANTLMKHLVSHVGTSSMPELFEEITKMRQSFLKEVLGLLISVQQQSGGEIPQVIKDKFLTSRYEWEPEED